MVTLATELPGGIDSVRLLAEHGVIAAIGHTDATYEQTVEAIDAGATVATHLFNAMPPLGHRAPGPIAALLEDERVTVELINDGTHLHPAALELAFHHAGAGRVAFITDAMDAAGFGDGRLPARPSRGGGQRRRGAAGGGRFDRRLDAHPGHRVPAGGHRGPAAGRRHRVSLSPPTRRDCSALYDRIGSLEPGKDADLVILDADFVVRGVMHQGDWVVTPRLG